jgi:hypothetical protein
VLFEFGGVSVCRQVALEGGGSGLDSTSASARDIPESRRALPVLNPAATDPRLLRDLPWRLRLDDPGFRRITEYAKWTSIYCLTLLLLPGAMLRTLVRRGVFDWPAAVGMLAALATFSIGMTIGGVDDESPLRIGRLLLALAGLPPVFFLGEMVRQAQRRQWRWVSVMLILFVVVTGALALTALRIHAARPELALQPMERYSNDGWYLIGLWGVYVAGILVLAFIAAKSAIRKARSRSLLRAGLAER